MFSSKNYAIVSVVLILAVSPRETYLKCTGCTTELQRKYEDGHSGEITITTRFPFFNKTFDSLYVNANGVISFNVTVTQFTPSRFPLRDGRTMIAPFWADVDIRKTGNVSYGECTNKEECLEEASEEVKKAFPGQFTNFAATWTFETTWEKVPFLGKPDSKPNTVNTFESKLITNGRHSFVRFNYTTIRWTSGTSSGGNKSGLGGVEPECGFNAGDGINWKRITNTTYLDLPYTTNVNQPGIWMFRLDNAAIKNGGCNTKGHLTIKPYKVHMLGGHNVDLHGPCYENYNQIMCKFRDGTPSKGALISYLDDTLARCTVPMVFFIGPAKLYLSLDNGTSYPFDGTFFYVSPEDYSEKPRMDIPPIMDNKVLVEIKVNTKRALPISKENTIVEIAKFQTEIKDSMEHSFRPKSITPYSRFHQNIAIIKIYLSREDVQSDDIKGGRVAPFLRVRSKNMHQTQLKTTHEWSWSDVLQLKNASENASERCQKWSDKEKIVPYDDDPTLIGCPTEKDAAIVDDGRFSEYKNDVFFKGQNRGKVKCFRTRRPSRNKHHGHQCCYSSNANGSLLLGHKEKAGTFFKKHQYADIPFISHYIYDILPYYDCCRWSDSSFCELYYRKRPSIDGSRYKAPNIGLSHGDPHIVTLDGVQYTFNGLGEFVILKTFNDEFMLQGRMEQLNRINGTSINATVYTAFAMKSNISDTVQIQLNDVGSVDVLVDGEKKDFDEEQTILFSNGHIERQPNTTKYVVLFSNEIAVTVEGDTELLQLMVKAPPEYIGKTSGLLGYFDNDKEKEFLLPNGTFLKTSSKAATLHYEFGLKWTVDANRSIFTYFGAKNHSLFTKPSFVPLMFDYDNLTFANAHLEAESRRICQDDVQCLIDAIATGQPSFALLSQNIRKEFKRVVKITERQDCISLFPEFAFGQMQRADLKDGGIQYFFKCDTNFVLDGPEKISCKNGKWNGTKPSCRGCSSVGKNVIVDSVRLTDLDEVTYKFSCIQGYELLGPKIAICKGGEWNGNNIACMKGCLPVTPNVVVINTNITAIDEITYTVSCKSGFEMVGPSTMKCRSGEWLSNITRCLQEPRAQVKVPVQQNSKMVVAVSISCSLAFVVIVASVWCRFSRKRRTSRKETIPAYGNEFSFKSEKESSKENTAVVLSVLNLSKY